MPRIFTVWSIPSTLMRALVAPSGSGRGSTTYDGITGARLG
jgi:hypothetical protein